MDVESLDYDDDLPDLATPEWQEKSWKIKARKTKAADWFGPKAAETFPAMTMVTGPGVLELDPVEVEVEFDPAKRDDALRERDLDMDDAPDVFAGGTLTVKDDRKDYGEHRYITIGSLDGRMVILAWTPRKEKRRIISMRKANEREQAVYGPRF